MLANLWKASLTVAGTVAVFLIGRTLLIAEGKPPEIMRSHFAESVFVSNGMLYQSLAAYMLILLSVYVLMFLIIQKGMQGRKITKGLLYGGLFAGLWFWGFLEMVFFFDAPLWDKVLAAIRDSLPLIACGVLAAVFWGSDTAPKPSRFGRRWLIIPTTAAGFAVGHGLQYGMTFHANTLPHINAVYDMADVIWLLGTGTWIGLMYHVFEPGLHFRSSAARSLFFAGAVFGTNWLFYNFFYHLFLALPVFDMCLRVGLGITGVWLGIIAGETLRSCGKSGNSQ